MFAPLPLLKRDDPVAVIAPAGPFEREPFERGLEVLRQVGLDPRPSPGVAARARYLAGSRERRLSELLEAFSNADTRAVFCARGGYGAMHLLPDLEVGRLADKPLVGFSDITALHLQWQRAGRLSVHGPVITQLGSQPPQVIDDLRALLFEGRTPTLTGIGVNGGEARGRLIGGNLAVLTRLLGTPYLPSLSGAVLLIEEVGERPYRLDRMLTHLRLAGVLGAVAGVAFGQLVACEEKDADYQAADVVAELLRELRVPAVMGLPVGHGEVNRPLLLGAEVILDGDRGTLSPPDISGSTRAQQPEDTTPPSESVLVQRPMVPKNCWGATKKP